MTSFGVPLGNDMAALRPGARSHIEQMVGRLHGFRIMFDHHHGVPQIAQAEQCLEQASIVPLMQTDRRLIEDVEDADQAGADLRGEPDALPFAARQRRGRPIQRQIIQTDIDEKPQPFANFFQNPMGNHQFAFREFQPREEIGSSSHRQMRDLCDRLLGQP